VVPIQVQYNHLQQAYTITSPNLNLTVTGNFNAPSNSAPPSQLRFGFTISVPPSFIQVTRFQGRYLLRDGHNRSFGLLSRGLPAPPTSATSPPPRKSCLPKRCPAAPGSVTARPLLRNHHDDLVAEPVLLPVPHRTIVIHAMELPMMNCSVGVVVRSGSISGCVSREPCDTQP